MHSAGRRSGGGQGLLLLFRFFLSFLYLELIYLRLDLGLEFVAGALELVERFSDLAGDLRELFGAEDQQSQHEDESGVAETHVPIIAEQLVGGNATIRQADTPVFLRQDFYVPQDSSQLTTAIEERRIRRWAGLEKSMSRCIRVFDWHELYESELPRIDHCGGIGY